MTPAERENPDLLSQAVVVGLLLVRNSFVEVNKFIKDFNQMTDDAGASGDMNKMMKQMVSIK